MSNASFFKAKLLVLLKKKNKPTLELAQSARGECIVGAVLEAPPSPFLTKAALQIYKWILLISEGEAQESPRRQGTYAAARPSPPPRVVTRLLPTGHVEQVQREEQKDGVNHPLSVRPQRSASSGPALLTSPLEPSPTQLSRPPQSHPR